MSQQFDASSKTLLDLGPAEWLAFLGAPRPPELVSVISADLATVTALADKVVLVGDPSPWILHIEFQAQHDATLPARMAAYNTALAARHKMPVASAAILLAPQANASNLTGRLESRPPLGPSWAFAYTVVKIWEMPTELFLNGPPSLIPLTMLTKLQPSDLTSTAFQVRDRLSLVEVPSLRETLQRAMTLLLNLRYDKMTIDDLVHSLGMRSLEESHGYQAWVNFGHERGVKVGQVQGRTEEARRIIHKLGTDKFGTPSMLASDKLRAISDLEILEEMADRLLKVNSWDELLSPKK